MNPSEDDVRAGIAWIKSLTLLHEDTVIRPAAMSYVKPSEYRRWVELRLDDVLALLDAGRKDRERLVGVQEKIGKLPKYSPRGGVEYFDCDDVLAVLGNGA